MPPSPDAPPRFQPSLLQLCFRPARYAIRVIMFSSVNTRPGWQPPLRRGHHFQVSQKSFFAFSVRNIFILVWIAGIATYFHCIINDIIASFSSPARILKMHIVIRFSAAIFMINAYDIASSLPLYFDYAEHYNTGSSLHRQRFSFLFLHIVSIYCM